MTVGISLYCISILPLDQSSINLFFFIFQGTNITLVWRIPGEIIGNEMDDTSMVGISLTSVGDQEIDTTNNDLINGPITIEYAAISDLSVVTV